MFRLDGKVALVTGASYGIGFAIAKGMAKAGATITFNDINQELVDKGLAAYEAEGIKIRAITPQNEPETDQGGRMPACYWSPETEAKFSIALKKKADQPTDFCSQ